MGEARCRASRGVSRSLLVVISNSIDGVDHGVDVLSRCGRWLHSRVEGCQACTRCIGRTTSGAEFRGFFVKAAKVVVCITAPTMRQFGFPMIAGSLAQTIYATCVLIILHIRIGVFPMTSGFGRFPFAGVAWI